MYPWSLQANLFMGGQCTFFIDPCNTVSSSFSDSEEGSSQKKKKGTENEMETPWRLAQTECRKNIFWPRDLDLWPMTLIFKVDPATIHTDPQVNFKTECLADLPRVENFPIAIQFLATYVIVMGASNHSESIKMETSVLAYVPVHHGYIKITSKGLDVEVLVKITDRSFFSQF